MKVELKNFQKDLIWGDEKDTIKDAPHVGPSNWKDGMPFCDIWQDTWLFSFSVSISIIKEQNPALQSSIMEPGRI